MLSKLKAQDDVYIILLVILFALPVYFFSLSDKLILGFYLLIVAVVIATVLGRFKSWWFPVLIGLIILLPGPLDRVFLSARLTPEAEANPYGIFSVIDILMFFTVFIRLKNEKKLHNLFNPRVNYLTIVLVLITLVGILSSIQSYLTYQSFYFPMAFRAIFYSARFLLVFSWISNYVDDLSELKKIPIAIYLITFGFVLLALLSPKENYEGGNRLSVATYGVNTFGHLLTFIALLCIPFISYFNKEKKKVPLFFVAACFFICLIFLLMSANRMSFTLLLFGILAYNLRMPAPFAKKLSLVFLFLSVFAATIFLFFLFKPELLTRVLGIFQIISGENALQDIRELQARFVVWNISLQMISSHPLLGIGPGQWNYLKFDFGSMPPWMSTILDPHNGYLLYTSEMGSICAILYYSILVVSIKRGYNTFKILKRNYKSTLSQDVKFYMSLILMMVIVIICWMLSDLTNASGLNIRVQSLMWSLCCILFISPSLSIKFLNRNYEN
jgi:O-antigen ligase